MEGGKGEGRERWSRGGGEMERVARQKKRVARLKKSSSEKKSCTSNGVVVPRRLTYIGKVCVLVHEREGRR